MCPGCGFVQQKPSAGRNFVKALRIVVFAAAMGVAGFVLSSLLDRCPAQPVGRRALARRPSRRSGRNPRPVARNRCIYLVQLGRHKAHYSLNDLANWLKLKYELDVEILPSMDAENAAWNPARHQYVAELLYDRIKAEHPDLAADPNAYIIAFTDASMFSVWHSWPSSFTQRDMKRLAIISSANMEDTWWEQIGISSRTSDRRLQQRLQRILLKDVAILYWHLPVNNDPTSLLHQTLDPDLPAEDIYASDLFEPMKTRWGRFEGEPCLFLRYSAADGIKPAPGDLVRSCPDGDDLPEEETAETFESSTSAMGSCSINTRTSIFLAMFLSSLSVSRVMAGLRPWDWG